MPWPVFDDRWTHESYQVPLSSDRISDIIYILQEDDKRSEHMFVVEQITNHHIFPYILFIKSYKKL